MTSPMMRVLDLVVRMNERDARKVRDIANGRLLELSEPVTASAVRERLPLGEHPPGAPCPPVSHRHWRDEYRAKTQALWRQATTELRSRLTEAEGAELLAGLTEAVDGPDEAEGHVGYTDEF